MANGRIKGITIEIDGDTKGLDTALKGVNQESGKLQSELKQVERALKFDPTNVELLRQKQELLTDSITQTSQKLDTLKQAQQQVQAQFERGDIGADQYRAFQRELIRTESQLQDLQTRADRTDLEVSSNVDTSGIDRAKSKLKELGSVAKQAGKEIGDGIKTGAAAGTAAIGAIVVGSNDLNSDLARLKTNASMAGRDLEIVEEAFKQISIVTGETDSAVETVSNLLASGFSDNQLASVIEGINGAAIKFSDTLKTEGIADGIQETFATGEAIGMFAELLERSGVDLETFNGKLAKAKKNGTEADLVLQTMAELGLGGVTEKYKELNPEVAKNAEETLNMQVALAELAVVLTPLITFITDLLTKIIEWTSSNPELATTLGVLAGVITGISSAFMVLSPLISGITTLLPVLVGVFSTISAPVLVVIAAIAGLAAAFVALWQNSETFRTNLTNVFESIKAVAVTVFETVASFIGEKISQIKQFWDTEGAQILQAAQNIFNGIMAVIQFVMPAIKLIVDVVWTAIKQVITGALDVIMGAVKIFSGLFTGDFGKMWEGVKQLFFGAINLIIGWFSLTFIGGIRSLLANLGKTAFSLVKGMWDNVLGIFKSMGGSVRSFTDDTLSKVIGFFRNFVTNVKSQMTNAKQGVIDIWNQAVTFLKNIDLKQIGKDIIQGLINGLGAMGSFVTEKIKEIANSIPKWAKKILDIHSPSRVMDKIGQQTGEGFANGIDKKKKAAVKAAKAVADTAKKNFESKMKDLSLKFKAGKIDTKSYMSSLETLKKDYKKVPLAISKVDAEIATLRKKNTKELFEVDKKSLDDKIKYGNLSMDQEMKLLQKTANQYKKNSEERIYFEDKVRDKLLQVNQEKQRINEKYLSDVKTLNQKYIDDVNRVNEEYQKAVDDRTKSLYSFAGIFDEVVQKDVSGDTLLMNLYSQVSAFQDWQKNIKALAKKGINEGLLAELQEMGPKAGAEIAALNTLTDVQLNQYVNLWKEKNALAKGQALNELKGIKADTAVQIEELRKATAAQLLVYQEEWKKAMVDTRGKVKNEMKEMPTIGEYAVSGLINGLSSKRKELITVAQKLANDVKGAFQGALDIHSPSRVFHGFGVNINEGLINGIQDSAVRLNKAMDNVYGSLASSASKSNANQIANQQIINQSSNNIDLSSLVEAIISLANRPVETLVNMDGRAVASAVSTHQYNDTSIAALMKGKSL